MCRSFDLNFLHRPFETRAKGLPRVARGEANRVNQPRWKRDSTSPPGELSVSLACVARIIAAMNKNGPAVVPKKPVVDGEKVGSLKVTPNYFPFRRSRDYSTSNKIRNSLVVIIAQVSDHLLIFNNKCKSNDFCFIMIVILLWTLRCKLSSRIKFLCSAIVQLLASWIIALICLIIVDEKSLLANNSIWILLIIC